MKRKTTILTALVVLTLGLILTSCAAQKAQKDVDTAAQGVVDARIKNQLNPTPETQATLMLAMETYNASVKAFERAKSEDDTKWGAITTLVAIGSAALGVPLGGLVDPFRKLVTGQVQGAQMATTAITNADTQNVLQDPSKRDAVLAGLTNAPTAVANAVATHL